MFLRMPHQKPEEEENFRNSIATVSKTGKRQWLYPKKPKGTLYKRRKWVGFLLVVSLFLGPLIKIKGHQLFLFNIMERKFHFFGVPFWPQDVHLLVIMLLIGIFFVVLFTVAYGRLFCGWICPQTVFLELIFRPIEYWIEGDRGAQIRLDKQPWDAEKIKKRGLKWFLYFVLSFGISNVFLAYFVSADTLFQYIQAPFEHLNTLIYLLCFSGVFYFVFTWFREQVCVIACPYGRLQGVLLDKNSVVVAYDHKRGEKTKGRAKFRKKENRLANGKGDCIDCFQCVHVCPTGIDIRNGTQLECVNCTACIDACDSMMEAVDLPKGLIRYASEAEITDQKQFRFTPRLKAYSVVLVVMIAALFVLTGTRSAIEATFLRIPGQLYQLVGNDSIQNVYAFKLVNKTNQNIENIELRLLSHQGKIYSVTHEALLLKAEDIQDGTVFVEIAQEEWKGKKLQLEIGLFQNNKLIETAHTQFLGPRNYY